MNRSPSYWLALGFILGTLGSLPARGESVTSSLATSAVETVCKEGMCPSELKGNGIFLDLFGKKKAAKETPDHPVKKDPLVIEGKDLPKNIYLGKWRTQFCSNQYSGENQMNYQSIVGAWDHVTCCPTIPKVPPEKTLVDIGLTHPELICRGQKLSQDALIALVGKKFPKGLCTPDSEEQKIFNKQWDALAKKLEPKASPVGGTKLATPAPEGEGGAVGATGPKGPPSDSPDTGSDTKVHDDAEDEDDTKGPTTNRGRTEATGQSVRAEVCGRDKLNNRHPTVEENHYYEVWVKAVGNEWVLSREGEPGASCKGMMLKLENGAVKVRGRVVPSFTDSNGRHHWSEVLGYQTMNEDQISTEKPYRMFGGTFYTVFSNSRGENLFVKTHCRFQGDPYRDAAVYLETTPEAETLEKVQYALSPDEDEGFIEVHAARTISRSSISSFTPISVARPADARPQ